MFSGNPNAGNQFGSGLGGFLGGLFGDSGAPYQQGMDEYMRWANQAQNAQNPFWQAGTGAIPQFQEWLGGMKDPSGFINKMMGQYQESPWAKYQQDQSMRAAQNAGSASGMGGSTPMAQFMQENAQNISSKDMQNWLGNVLGTNTLYGQGLSGMMQGGQGAANALTNLFGQMGRDMGGAQFGKGVAEQNDWWNMFGGLGKMLGGLGSFFL